MLYHFFGLQGGGKSWFAVVLAYYDFFLKSNYQVFTNFYTSFGGIISIKKLLNFEYNKCVLIIDEAYGVADAHQTSKANDYISEVIHQSRKRKVEVFFITQLQSDLYTRIRNSAHRRIECANLGSEEKPILSYIVTDNKDNLLNSFYFDTIDVRSAYHLYNTEEPIMPMHLNPELTFEKVMEIYNDCTSKKTFETLLNDENKFITKDVAGSVYELLKNGKEERARGVLKIK